MSATTTTPELTRLYDLVRRSHQRIDDMLAGRDIRPSGVRVLGPGAIVIDPRPDSATLQADPTGGPSGEPLQPAPTPGEAAGATASAE